MKKSFINSGPGPNAKPHTQWKQTTLSTPIKPCPVEIGNILFPENTVDPDQLASDEAIRADSTLILTHLAYRANGNKL